MKTSKATKFLGFVFATLILAGVILFIGMLVWWFRYDIESYWHINVRMPKIHRSIFNHSLGRLSDEELREVIDNHGALEESHKDYGRPLSSAISWDNATAVEMLIEAGAETDSFASLTQVADSISRGFAAENMEQRWRILDLLLEAGADVNAHDKYGDTPLLAAISNSTDYASMGFDPESPIPSSQYRIGEEEYERLLKTLLEHGAAPNIANDRRSTPLHLAVINNDHVGVRVLLEYGADPHLADSLGSTPTDLAIMGASPAVWEALNENGVETPDDLKTLIDDLDQFNPFHPNDAATTP